MDEKEVLKHIKVKKGDITQEEVDAIVNAANISLLGGGGVDGAIHRKAGPGLVEECRKFGGCNTGEARITKGYNLKAKHVIHTPGPVYRGGKNNEPGLLRNSYLNSMILVKENNLKSVSFPAISTGVYRYPKHEAAQIAIETVINFMSHENYVADINFVLFDDDNFEIYNKLMGKMKNELH